MAHSGPPSESNPPYECGAYTVADFNNDGVPDIACFATASVLVYSGLGGGLFSTPANYPVEPSAGSAYFTGTAVGSLRNNGKLDIIVPVNIGEDLLFNTGSGFEETPRFSAPGSAAFVAADLNGDGITDLITVGSEGFEVFWGTGKASKPFVSGPVSLAGILSSGNLTLGDFNGDGFLDAAVVVLSPEAHTDKVAVCFGDGQGHFAAPIYTETSYESNWISTADLNGDGKLDIVTSGVSVQFGNGDGTFQPPVTLSSFAVSNIVIADLNGDGKPDIVTSISYPTSVEVFLNQGNGTFGSPLFPWEYEATAVTACDVNGDGIPDLLLAAGAAYPNVFLGNGNGTFVPVANSSTSQLGPTALACGLFTGTQRLPEVAMISDYYSSMVVETDPGGTGAYTLNENTWGTGSSPLGVIVGKFHGPSKVDDVLVLNGDGTISYFLNDT